MKDKYFTWIDKIFTKTDRSHIRRTRNIRLIPDFRNRRGGKLAYSEWAHVIGIFQTVIYQELAEKTGNAILDIGSGTGLLGISSEPFVSEGGKYTGIDVMQEDINYCRSQFKFDNYEFIHLDVGNASYASDQKDQLIPWGIENGSQDLVTALSVWTHFREEHALFYMKEVSRVLKKGGKAIITFFYLNEDYQQSLNRRSDSIGRYHSTNQNFWIYNKPAYDSKNWFTVPSSVFPEDAIGITPEGMKLMLDDAGLKLEKYYPGNWKEIPGVYFQDILVLIKE